MPISSTSYTPTTAQALTPGDPYLWYVGAVSSNGKATAWSNGEKFSITALTTPTADTPTDTLTSDRPTFNWADVSGADHYDVWVDDESTGQKQVLRDMDVIGTALTVPLNQRLQTGDDYIWWVAAVSTNGVVAVWSNPLDFTIS